MCISSGIIPFLNKIYGWQKENEEVNLQEEMQPTLMKVMHHWLVWTTGSDITPTMSILTFWWIPFVVTFYSFFLCKISFIHHTENIYPAILLHLNITTPHWNILCITKIFFHMTFTGPEVGMYANNGTLQAWWV